MNFKKVILALSALFLVVGLAACGSDDKDTKTLTILALKPEMDEALQAYAKAYGEANDVTVEVTTCGGSSCSYAEKMDQLSAQGKTPDIFYIEGYGAFETYQNIAMDLSDEKWVEDTDYAFMSEGKVYGFPIAVEGFGLTYNKDILDAAGIDPATLTSYEGYEAAFKILNEKKDELGIVAPASMAVGSGMTWVSGLHQFNSYLSAGLDAGDSSVVTDLRDGKVDQGRLDDYAKWTELLYANSEQEMLVLPGDTAYGEQVKLFTDGKTAFLHQGNWADGDITNTETGLDAEVGLAPTGMGQDSKVFVGAPGYFMVNKDGNTELATKFLNDLHSTDEGQKLLFVDAGGISPFKSVEIDPASPLAKNVSELVKSGETSPWNQNTMPDGYGMQNLGPIHELYAKGEITLDEFKAQITAQIEGLAK